MRLASNILGLNRDCNAYSYVAAVMFFIAVVMFCGVFSFGAASSAYASGIKDVVNNGLQEDEGNLSPDSVNMKPEKIDASNSGRITDEGDALSLQDNSEIIMIAPQVREVLKYDSSMDMVVKIDVDETSSTTEEAKEEAMQASRKHAFWVLLDRVVPEHADTVQQNITSENVNDLIQKVEITNEIKTPGRYRASIVFTFDEGKTVRTLAEHVGLLANTGVDTLVVLPALDDGVSLFLWEKENIWRNIVNETLLELGINKVVAPFGDPRDRDIVTNSVLLSGDRAILKKIAERYGTRNAVIMMAKPRLSNKYVVLNVLLRRAGANGEEAELRYAARPGEKIEDLMKRAAIDVIPRLAEPDDKYVILQPDKSTTRPLKMRIEFTKGREWKELQDMLQGLPMVEKLEIHRVSVDFVVATLYHKSSRSLIQQLLLQRKLNVRDDDNLLVISKKQ